MKFSRDILERDIVTVQRQIKESDDRNFRNGRLGELRRIGVGLFTLAYEEGGGNVIESERRRLRQILRGLELSDDGSRLLASMEREVQDEFQRRGTERPPVIDPDLKGGESGGRYSFSIPPGRRGS
ncbi:MAG: hypothetical protein OEY44_04005 [Candidatus Peregrinibacteria bacterium]|nr:hypothetical protein [Candidatus Peregrinibacteria bacterium]